MDVLRPVMTVWVDGWQLQCCGEPFEIGSLVSWTMKESVPHDFASVVLGEALAATVTHRHEDHGDVPDDTPTTVGTVRSIRAVSCAYVPSAANPNMSYPLPNSLNLVEKASADGWEPETEVVKFLAYLVELQPHDDHRQIGGD